MWCTVKGAGFLRVEVPRGELSVHASRYRDGAPGNHGVEAHGPWALPLTCRRLALARRRVGPDFPLIGTNGARDGLDVARFLLAGASAVEMASAVMTRGFRTISESLQELQSYLVRQRCDARALIGEAADRLQGYAEQLRRPGWREPPDSLSPRGRGKEGWARW